ncbi:MULTISPECIES: glycosyltransferase family 2 protein [Actinomadura]|uniref:Glycosyltransferase family 2 protein n=1 Tax=Actinomadura yumaensis TaxID=111807 RepID=A0ABW2CIV0_9ACTN|nr:glycosyltransferase family 2 protein [Actinomadura sp. J1-007]MWK40044.1 glycosyltransferase [Actinomadura sp. J1-007]
MSESRQAGPLPTVTVVTPTRGRTDLLVRAMESAAAQRNVHVEHIVLGDRCLELAALRGELAERFPEALVRNVTLESDPDLPMDYRPARLAYLRNKGARLGSGEFVAQLDDDNTFEPDHLETLVAALRAAPGAGAAHSWRRVWNPDGTPYLLAGEDPWHPDPDRRARSFAQLSAHGVFEPGSNVVRDVFVAGGRLVARVDTSEFLVRRTVFEDVPFPERFSAAKRRLEITEDVAYAQVLYRRGIEVVPSRRATLNYFMGGYSNAGALGSA